MRAVRESTQGSARPALAQVQFWLRYFELGGMTAVLEAELIVHEELLAAATANWHRTAGASSSRPGEAPRASTVPTATDGWG